MDNILYKVTGEEAAARKNLTPIWMPPKAPDALGASSKEIYWKPAAKALAATLITASASAHKRHVVVPRKRERETVDDEVKSTSLRLLQKAKTAPKDSGAATASSSTVMASSAATASAEDAPSTSKESTGSDFPLDWFDDDILEVEREKDEEGKEAKGE